VYQPDDKKVALKKIASKSTWLLENFLDQKKSCIIVF